MRVIDTRVYANRFKVMPHYSVGYSREISGSNYNTKMPDKNVAHGVVSYKAGVRIRNVMNWLMYFSEKKWVWSALKKKGYYFRINFITLTLPMYKDYSDEYIVAHLLQPFLKWMARKHNAVNYIWKAEIQPKRFEETKERCLHFHITTNKFIHYKAVNNKWKRLLVAHGYLKSTLEYCRTEIKAVVNEGEMVYYMAKYILKQADSEDLKVKCKVWGCNHVLSQLSVILREEECATFYNDTAEFIEKYTIGEIKMDYCVLLYNQFKHGDILPGDIGEGFVVAHDMFLAGDNGVIKYRIDKEVVHGYSAASPSVRPKIVYQCKLI